MDNVKTTKCAKDLCGVMDFLPIECEFCRRQFCEHHFKPGNEGHECANYRSPDVRGAECPLCGEVLRYQWPATEASALAAHTCSRPRRTARQQCVACKQTLDLSDQIKCRTCRQVTCLRHRQKDDHNCGSSAAPKTTRNDLIAMIARFTNFRGGAGH